MKKQLVALAAVLLTHFGSASADTGTWSSINYFLTPVNLPTVNGHVYAMEQGAPGSPPFNDFSFYHGSLQSTPLAYQPTWPIGDVTGTYISPNTGRELSEIPGCCQSAVQAGGFGGADSGTYGIFVNTAYLPLDTAHQSPGTYFFYAWDIPSRAVSPPPFPWTTATSRLVLEYSVKVPTANITGTAMGYVLAMLAIYDRTTGGSVIIQPNIMIANMPAGRNVTDDVTTVSFGAGVDGYVSPNYIDNGTFMSKWDNPAGGQYSSVSQTAPFSGWKWFALSMTRQQLLNLINKINTTRTPPLSTNPADYSITQVGIQNEINRVATSTSQWQGLSMKQMYLYELR